MYALVLQYTFMYQKSAQTTVMMCLTQAGEEEGTVHPFHMWSSAVNMVAMTKQQVVFWMCIAVRLLFLRLSNANDWYNW